MAPVLWLDVTRLVSRAGRGVLTGIDRVEHAWLRHLLDRNHPDTRYILRSTRGFVLLDHRGAGALAAIMAGDRPLGQADLWSRMLGKGSEPRHRVEAVLRPLAVDRALPAGLSRMIARHAEGAVWYLNTGHSNLSQRTLSGFAQAAGVRVAVLIHDLIPITHPDLVQHDVPARFADRLARVRANAALVICNSQATAEDLDRHWQDALRSPPRLVAHLGVDGPHGGNVRGKRDPRHFVMLGTIEPRKNHALMLDVWERLAADLPGDLMPDLHIIGPVGWRVDALMARIAAHPLLGRSIHLHGALPEPEMRALLARATALLFPSLAEGYGYPPLEAAQYGAVPICSDLAVFRETLGNSAVYLAVRDTYSWSETIKKHVLGTKPLHVPALDRVPEWSVHFETVGAALAHDLTEGR